MSAVDNGGEPDRDVERHPGAPARNGNRGPSRQLSGPRKTALPGWGYRAGVHSPEATSSSCQLSSIRPPPPSCRLAIPLKVEPRLEKWILPSTIR